MARRGRGRGSSSSSRRGSGRGRGRGRSSNTAASRSTRGMSRAQRREAAAVAREASNALRDNTVNDSIQANQPIILDTPDVVEQQALQYEERVRQVVAATPPPPRSIPDEEKEGAFIDSNTVIYLNDEMHSEMQYAPLYIPVNESIDYAAIAVYNGETEVASTNLSITDDIISISNSLATIDVLRLVRDKLGLGNGQYDIEVCLYRNYIYNQEDSTDIGEVQIEEVSPTRREIRVKTSLPKYYNTVEEWGKTPRLRSEFEYQVIWPAILKDNTRRINILSTNWVPLNLEGEVEDHIIFRLVDPLPRNVKVGDQFQITRDIVTPYVIPVTVDLENIVTEEFNELRGPNYKAINLKDKPGKSSDFETWNTILGTNATTKQTVLDTYISSSDNVELNIDYRRYDNFIHFSSAEERLKNFKYKLNLIEHYTSQSTIVSTGQAGKGQSAATGSAEFLQNKAMYETKRANVISGFDGYEKYLYYESHSTETTSYGVFPAATWPKGTTSKPYTLLHTTSSEGKVWYASQLSSASIYDSTNDNILRNTVPQHIQQDTNSSNYVLFTDMIGQHFDKVFNHIDQITNIVDREESVYDGLSKDLIYDAAKSFGWTLQPGFDSSKLWEYALGTDAVGSYASGSTTAVRDESYSHQDIEKQTWKRILNNIPYLLKTKGTSRGIKALLNTYGIPNTILRVQEYGGPAPTRLLSTRREIEKFSYALDFSGSSHISTVHSKLDADNDAFSFTTNTDRFTSMYEFRFDTATTQSMHIVSTDETSSLGVSKFEVILEHSSSAAYDSDYRKYGRLLFKITSGSANSGFTTMSTDYAPFYDNDWWNVSFGTQEYITGPSTSQPTFEIRYAKIGEHADDITHSGSTTFTPADVSATKQAFNEMWGNNQNMLWGGTGSGLSTAMYNAFSGSMQEIRGWAEHISDNAFYQHALSPISITGDTIEMAYNDLIMRYPLGTNNKKYNHSTVTTLSATSSIPNTLYATPFIASVNTNATFIGWPDTISYSNKSETYYVDVPNTVGSTANDSKIRIEDNSLRTNQLAWDKKFEVSPNDTNPLDSDEVSIAFSPQDQIDTDIAMQFGGFSLDDYVGDPRDKFNNRYKGLENTRNLYFKKYDDKYNIWAFIRMLKYINTGFWKQLENLLPARADATVGIIIRPNILERHKVKDVGSVSITDNAYHAQITMPDLATVAGEIPYQRVNNTDFGIYTATLNVVKTLTPQSHTSTIGLDDINNSQGNSSTGYHRLTRIGSKVSSTAFNTPSEDTVDGAPVVEFMLTNPNKLYAGENSALNIVEERYGSGQPRGGRTEMGDLTVE